MAENMMWGEIVCTSNVVPSSSSSSSSGVPRSTKSSILSSKSSICTPVTSSSTSMTTTGSASTIEQVIDRLITRHPDAFKRNYQHDESRNLDRASELLKTVDLYKKRPEDFLRKFGSRLCEVCEWEEVCSLFNADTRESNAVVDKLMMHVQASFKAKRSRSSNKRVRNRRYTAMMKLMKEEDKEGHFGEKAMREREPWLYDTLVKRFIDKELHEEMESNSISNCSLSTMITNHLDLVRQRELRDAQRRANGDDDHGDDDDDDVNDEYDDDKASRCRREFLQTMQERFLAGLDDGIDYEAIDNDETMDNNELMERDAEDKYFDED